MDSITPVNLQTVPGWARDLLDAVKASWTSSPT